MEQLLQKLKRPTGRVDVVLDTDTYNEIDDQFALSYLIKSDEKLNVKAIYAAPFFNHRSTGPADGMEKSYEEILRFLTLMDREDLSPSVFRGSKQYMEDECSPVHSPAAEDLMRRAMDYTPGNPLYVVAIGAITNVASALVMNPKIIDRIVLVWLGGNAHNWHDNREFNLMQDVAAARIVFGCGVALVQLPCSGVVSCFTTTGPELTYHLAGKNKLCDYLLKYTAEEAIKDGGNSCWSRVIWDVTAVAWLLDEDFMLERLEKSPIPEFDHRYSFDCRRHFINYVYHINRDALMEDLFRKLAR